MTNRENEAKKPQFEWVTIEHRDSEGNPTFPKELIASTFTRRYDEVPEGTEIKVYVLAGYKPKALIMVERKIYEIHRLSVQGWRRSGQISVEMDDWRRYEADWFNAMRDIQLEVSDPGTPGPHNEKAQYVVSASNFHKKIVKYVDELGTNTEIHLWEGTLDITETWRSAWRRQAAEILNMGSKYFLLPVLSALLAGLVVWWLERSPNPDSPDSALQESAPEQILQEGTGDSENKPSDRVMNSSPTEIPPNPVEDEKQDSTSKTSKESTSRP